MIRITNKGNFEKANKYFSKLSSMKILPILDKYGQKGVEALRKATPVKTGKTAASWKYEVKMTKESYTITWSNSNTNEYANIAILLDQGHGTRNGGYVAGKHFIDPTLQPILKEIAESAWQEVKNA